MSEIEGISFSFSIPSSNAATISCQPYRLKLRSAFGTSHSSTTERTNALIRITFPQEKAILSGFGEGFPHFSLSFVILFFFLFIFLIQINYSFFSGTPAEKGALLFGQLRRDREICHRFRKGNFGKGTTETDSRRL